MAQPVRWLWGLAPLALLWTIGNFSLDDAIQRDVGRRAVAAAAAAAGNAPGVRPIATAVSGRDVSVSGEVSTVDGAGKAMSLLQAEFGVRRALGGLSQAVAQKPYSWFAARDGDAVQLGGYVPDEATATANVAAAEAALPGAKIADRQRLAFGAPPGFGETAKAAIAALATLSTGKIGLDDSQICVEGRARTPDDFLALGRGALAGDAFKRADCKLSPPVVAPYRWSAERLADGGVKLDGFVPDDATRQKALAALRATALGAATIDDRTKPAAGEPPDFLDKITRAFKELAQLRSGKVELDGGAYRIAGEGPTDFAACEALRLQIAQLDGPGSVAVATIACPPAPPPLPALPALPEIPPLNLTIAPPPAPAPAPAPVAVPAPAVTPAPAGGAAPQSPPLAPQQVAPAPQPPPPAPRPVVALRWRAEKTADRLVLDGLVPDEAARAVLLGDAEKARGGLAIDDRMMAEPDLASTPDYRAATGYMLELLGAMTQGVVSLDTTQAALSGAVADQAGWLRLTELMARRPVPAGLALAAPSPASLGVRPYTLGISVDKSGLNLSGYLPDEQARNDIAALVAASPLKGKFTDLTQVTPGAPAAFAVAARVAVANLLRLDLGGARLDEDGLLVQGLTCRDLIKSEVETGVATSLPPGFAGKAEIGLRQTGCVIDPPNTCQNDLDALTKRFSVLFGQGTSVVTLDQTTDRVIGEAYEILKQCPASRVTIEGHANYDGERRGFDNLDLSNRRALRVREELIKRGVAPAQLETHGFGTERPLVPHGEQDAKVKNRRVQFTVAK